MEESCSRECSESASNNTEPNNSLCSCLSSHKFEKQVCDDNREHRSSENKICRLYQI